MRYVIYIILLFGLACSKAEPETPSTEAAPGEAAAAATEPGDAEGQPEGPSAGTAKEPSAGALPSIKLVSPGSEPRRALRRTFTQGSKETMRIRSQVTIVAQMGISGESETVTPPIVHTLALEVRSVDADGVATVGFEVLRSKVLRDKKAAAHIRNKVEAAASSIPGLKGTYQVDARGVVSDVAIIAPAEGENRDRSMADSIGEFLYRSMAPLPEEAVGLGGAWTVARRLVEGAITVDRTSTYELQKLDRSRFTVGIKTEKTAPLQEVGTPGTYSHFEVKTFAAKGEGELHADLDKLVPREASSKTETELKMFMQKKDGLALQKDLKTTVQERMTSP